MGDHGGNIGLFEIATSDKGVQYEYKDCRYYETTIIWIYLITAAVWIALLVLLFVFMLMRRLLRAVLHSIMGSAKETQEKKNQ
jgi:hypothetical protein